MRVERDKKKCQLSETWKVSCSSPKKTPLSIAQHASQSNMEKLAPSIHSSRRIYLNGGGKPL